MNQSLNRISVLMSVCLLLVMGCETAKESKMTNESALEVTIREVSFKSQGETLIGDLYIPGGYKTGETRPAVLVTGAWTTVKEQMPATYARELSARGYVVLVFDFSGWGESSGEHRYIEDPESKTADIISAAVFLAKQSEVDSTQVMGVGICASSGYMAMAFAESGVLKSAALVAPWLHDPELATQVYGGEASVSNLISMSDNAIAKFERSGEATLLTAASLTDENAVMYQAPYYTEKDRGLIDAYDNQFNVASWRGWLTYDAMASARSLPGTLLMVGSEQMALPAGANMYATLAGDQVKQVEIDGATQFDFYDQPEVVLKAVEFIEIHFKEAIQ